LRQQIFRGVYARLIALCDSFNTTVGKVSNPAREPEFTGCLAGPLSKAYSLHTTLDKRM
jgi:hypothetical protein